MDFSKLIDSLTPEMVARLSEAVETGKWPDGKTLNVEQKESSIQAIMLYAARLTAESDEPFTVTKQGELVTGKKMRSEFGGLSANEQIKIDEQMIIKTNVNQTKNFKEKNMLKTIIRKEHKNQWERRAPLIPEAVKALTEQGLEIELEPCDIRIFSDLAYQDSGAKYPAHPDQAEFVLGIKEPPVSSIKHGQVHLAFSHTIKGQDYNMPLLQKFIDEKATLFDYEPIVDPATGQRTIAFGRYAGIAGAVDSFHILGQKLAQKGYETPLSDLKMTHNYGTVEHLKKQLAEFNLQQGEAIRALVVGTGKVGKGSIEVCEWLGLPKVSAEDFLAGNLPEGSFYSVLSSRHINKRSDGSEFDMNNFVEQGVDAYESSFDQVLGKFNILLQTPYWTEKYPKHLDKTRMIANKDKLPLVVGDISCDINGSLECTTKASDIGTPAFTYNLEKDASEDGISWDGVTVISIDNLPCELPIDASNDFSVALKTYTPQIMAMDLTKSFGECGLPDDLKEAVITYKGELTPKYQYLKEFL